MGLTKEEKSNIVSEFGAGEKNTGSTEVQIALLTRRIANLTEHLKQHKHDHHTRRGLVMMVGKRRRLLNYLEIQHLEKYRDLIKTLNLRR
ncbi:MAG: 30S ribosomal protein S15 [Candidatus Marinimicrobia bacterium]|nr:30S ribosomal protein S15 [Candidatus Neomarinimicrobiota bacterium]